MRFIATSHHLARSILSFTSSAHTPSIPCTPSSRRPCLAYYSSSSTHPSSNSTRRPIGRMYACARGRRSAAQRPSLVAHAPEHRARRNSKKSGGVGACGVWALHRSRGLPSGSRLVCWYREARRGSTTARAAGSRLMRRKCPAVDLSCARACMRRACCCAMTCLCSSYGSDVPPSVMFSS